MNSRETLRADAQAEPHLPDAAVFAHHEAGLQGYVSAAQAAWPDLNVEVSDLVRHIQTRSPGGRPPPLPHAGDMLLACACLLGLPSAISAFHTSFGGVIRRVLAHRNAEAGDADDATQLVYERLLVRPKDGEPKLADYRGTGALRSWVSTTVAKTILTLRRSEGRRRGYEHREAATTGAIVAAMDPELLYFKRLYKDEIQLAVTRSFESLDDHSRALLELHLLEHLSIDQLGTMYGVNRGTAARWLVAARESLVRAVRAHIQRQLRLSNSDYDGIVALVRSELDVVVVGHFGGRPKR